MYVQNLQIQLQGKLRRVAKAHWRLYNTEIGRLVEFIETTPALRAILIQLQASELDFDPADWRAKRIQHNNVEFPPGEVMNAKFCWYLLNDWKNKGQTPAGGFGTVLRRGSHDDGMSEVTTNVVEPLVEFFSNRLGTESDVLYLLARYVRHVEWFEIGQLFKRYETDTARGERVYDDDLRRFLFDQGIDYPFSQPASASGKADVIAGLDGEDPLVCEVKLFDAGSYGTAYIAKGVNQAVSYARDYGKTTAIVVIPNLSDRELEFESDGDDNEWPPKIEVAGITVYLVSFRALPREPASKRGTARIHRITRDDLLKSGNI